MQIIIPKKLLVVIILSVASAFLFIRQQEQSPDDAAIQFQGEKLKYILHQAFYNYVDSLDIEKFSDKAFADMMHHLDPHSVYFNKEEYKIISANNAGASEGIGITIINIDDTVYITDIVPESPAAKAGLRAGDKIVSVDGMSVTGSSMTEIYNNINGEPGTDVALKIVRHFNKPEEFKITREVVPVPAVDAALIIPGTHIGFIKLLRFSMKSYEEFSAAIDELSEKGMKSLIIDLRNNTGGVLSEVVSIIDKFLQKGDKITYTEARNKEYLRSYVSTEYGAYKELPVVIIINEKSASASEILAGAFQDLDRAIVIGQPSTGKGLVQKYWEINDGSAFRMTVAEYYTPSGRCIQKSYDNSDITLDPAADLTLDSTQKSQLLDAVKKFNGKTKLPIYYTNSGRTVIGGGGIYPDIFAADDSLTVLTNVMKTKGIILKYTYRYLTEEKREQILEEYKEDFQKFSQEFAVFNGMLDDLKQTSYDAGYWNQEMFNKDIEYLSHFLKANIAHALWGYNGFYSVMAAAENQIVQAANNIAEAELMLHNYNLYYQQNQSKNKKESK